MKNGKFVSDYDPETCLRAIQTDDGDVILKIYGSGEFRIAMDGGKLHGKNLVDVIGSFSRIIDVFEKEPAGQRRSSEV